jgi:hypothetical protein
MELIAIQVSATVAILLGHFLDVVWTRWGTAAVDNACVVRYDDVTGRGDHKHLDEIKVPYHFTDLDATQADFWASVHLRRK